MKIAFVAQPFDVLPTERGGSIAIWIDAVASRLATSHEVAVYSTQSAGQQAHEVRDGISHVRVSAPRDQLHIDALRRLERGIRRITGREQDLFYRHYYFARRYHQGYVSEVAGQLASSDAAVVAVPNFAQFLPVLKRSSPDKRFVLNMHCDWLIELDEARLRPWLEPVDGVSGCSRYISHGVADRFPHLANRCRPVYSASDPGAFGEVSPEDASVRALRAKLGLEGRRVVLFTGRICPEKGVDVLVDAFRRVAAAAPDAVLLVVGGLSQQPPSPRWVFHRDPAYAHFEAHRGDYRSHLESLRHGLDDRVRFVRSVPHAELPAYYALCELFVHPAAWKEPFGMILTEAMLAQRAVVSTRTGGIPEIVDDPRTGLLAEPGDPVTLADRIIELLADPERCRAMGERGRQRVLDTFTWDHTTRQLEELLQLVVEEAD